MSTLTKEQIRHKVINLAKTLKLLERSVREEDWSKFASTSDRTNKWLKAQTVLGGIKQCRALLQEVSPSDYDLGLGDRRSLSGEQFHDDAKETLDRLERVAMEANKELMPRPKRLKPILPTLPRPPPPQSLFESKKREEPPQNIDETLIPIDRSELKEQIELPSELLLEASPIALDATTRSGGKNLASTLIPESLPSSAELVRKHDESNSMPGFLKTSTAVQEDLADQLAQMARQLKLNARHFSESLEKDKGVIQGVEEKVEMNYDVLTKERVRLRDHRGKSRGTTCLVLLSILVVFVGFFLTFFLIRIT